MKQAIELFNHLTTELSKLENDLINSTILSYETELEDMSVKEIFEAGQELVWMAQDLQGEQEDIDDDEDEPSYSDEVFIEDIVEEAERYLLEISDLM